MERLYDLDDKCNAYLSEFKQYTFAAMDSPDSVFLPEVASPMSLAAMYVDILSKHRLLDINADNVILNYYDNVHRYSPGSMKTSESGEQIKSRYDYDIMRTSAA
ncbi:hypothetical protein MTO96_038001 [Rhipicephalus appendiculatus]